MHKSEKNIFTTLTGIALLIMASGLVISWGEGSEAETMAPTAWRAHQPQAKSVVESSCARCCCCKPVVCNR